MTVQLQLYPCGNRLSPLPNLSLFLVKGLFCWHCQTLKGKDGVSNPIKTTYTHLKNT